VNDVQVAPALANDVQAAPAAGAHIEQPLLDFVSQMQGNPLSDASHFANPAALAAELVGSLRGFTERGRSLEMATRMSADRAEGGGIDMASPMPADAAETKLHGGPARERLEPADSDTGVSAAAGVSLAQLRRTMDVALASMNFLTETTLVVHGTSQINNSADTLFKGQ
jgi:hypothetical protein